MKTSSNPLRALPSVDALISSEAGAALAERYGRAAAVDAVREALAEAREHLRENTADVTPASLFDSAAAMLHRSFSPTLRPVINATGIIIHTNLGRAPLSEAAQRAVVEAAAHYSTLEYNLETGKRGSRLVHAEAVLRDVTGAEAALVVNNNAAALALLLSGLAKGREVIISRGQLVEIGGGFRIPEVMEQSGAILREVGATNRTRAADYEHAITPETALLLRAHASNFKQIGFTESAPLEQMAQIAHEHGLLLVDDLGSGALLDTAQYGLEHEPTAQESLAAGADLVCFSADKLLGGPQAGILIGRQSLIDQLKRHPLARAIRADKLCLAALTATLNHYRKGEAAAKIPVWRMIARPLVDIERTAKSWAGALGDVAAVIPGESAVGGGSLPGATLPTALLVLNVPDADAFTAMLRAADPPIIARIADGRVLLDPRTVLPGQEGQLLEILVSCLQSGGQHHDNSGILN
jgi:L-seryl-tRNA(Ser) seleniumtransferase